MRRDSAQASPDFSHALHYLALVDGHRCYDFPCDVTGRVELDRLSDEQRIDFLYAKHLVGLEFRSPCVEHIAGHAVDQSSLSH